MRSGTLAQSGLKGFVLIIAENLRILENDVRRLGNECGVYAYFALGCDGRD